MSDNVENKMDCQEFITVDGEIYVCVNKSYHRYHHRVVVNHASVHCNHTIKWVI